MVWCLLDFTHLVHLSLGLVLLLRVPVFCLPTCMSRGASSEPGTVELNLTLPGGSVLQSLHRLPLPLWPLRSSTTSLLSNPRDLNLLSLSSSLLGLLLLLVWLPVCVPLKLETRSVVPLPPALLVSLDLEQGSAVLPCLVVPELSVPGCVASGQLLSKPSESIVLTGLLPSTSRVASTRCWGPLDFLSPPSSAPLGVTGTASAILKIRRPSLRPSPVRLKRRSTWNRQAPSSLILPPELNHGSPCWTWTFGLGDPGARCGAIHHGLASLGHRRGWRAGSSRTCGSQKEVVAF